jgi:hypothetical protein
MTTAVDIAIHLEDNAFGTTDAPSPTIFIGYLPDTPDDCIAVYDTPGRPSELHGLDQPNFQIVVRNSSYASAATIIKNIQDLLQFTTNTTINGTFYLNIYNLQSPFSAGRDEKSRVELKQNYVTQKR